MFTFFVAIDFIDSNSKYIYPKKIEKAIAAKSVILFWLYTKYNLAGYNNDNTIVILQSPPA